MKSRPSALGRGAICALAMASTCFTFNAARADDEDPALGALEWRSIGPSRGGRAQSVAGVPGDPLTYYMGATGGGVWKTTNAGVSWENISDGFLGTGSVGDVCVAPSDPNVIYVGMGEADVRGNFSHGDGVYGSVDAGKTWRHLGLEDSRQIGRIEVHPNDPDTVYVAALGHVFGPNAQRGVFRSTDGGESWERILYVDDKSGAVDLSIDPLNPRVVYAAFWQVSRKPWRLDSGGPGSGLYKSVDGGDTWSELTEGLPEGIKGKIGVSASAAQRDLVYAIVEAEDGGVFRSTDAGETWSRTSQDPNLRQRAWYYTHVYADTQDANTVYVMNVFFMKSTDGGSSFRPIRVPHGDNHDLWIAPEDNRRMVNANDGGANVSFNGGRTWSRQDNQPTAQFYHVITDDQFPYRVYGAQQDNSTASVSSRARPGSDEFYAVGGGESGYIAPKPGEPDIVYAGSYGGFLTRYDHSIGASRNIMVWPENPMGAGAEELEYRFQWTFPIVISPHDPETVYVGGNVLFRTADGGQSWERISPDLTTDDPTKQASSGGPITQDNTGVEYYCTIFTVAESPLEPGLIWAGSDDGLVHVTSDAGESWTNVTPSNMGDWPRISLVEVSPHDPDKAYLAINRYQMNDFAPYIYRTTDRGRTWDLIVSGIDPKAFVRAVREDPVREGLLFAGTETGVYYSMDDGQSWHSLQLELPVVPITDLVIHEEDLVVATQGRSFWILDDLAPLRQWDDEIVEREMHLFEPGVVYRKRWDRVRVNYWLKEEPDQPVTIAFRDANGNLVREFRSDKPEEVDVGFFARMFGFATEAPEIGTEPGMHLFEWDMRQDAPEKVKGAVFWGPNPRGARIKPGVYHVQLCMGDEQHLHEVFEIRPDPRIDTSPTQFDEQEEMLDRIVAKLNEVHEAVNRIADLRSQIDAALARARRAGADEPLTEPADAIRKALKAIEDVLIQTRSKSPQDPLNYPIRLNNKISNLQAIVDSDYPVTAQSYEVFDKLSAAADEQLDALARLLESDVAAFNDLVAQQAIPAIILTDESPEKAEDEQPATDDSSGE